jgi:DNA end-binding protein Ku
LKTLEEGGSHIIEIISFVPEKSVDPRYYDKAYLLAPDKRGGKPYTLLMEAMRKSGKSALAKWAWKAKQYVVQVRATEEGLVLQQLLYADEVRSFEELNIEKIEVSSGELQLALQLIDQISEDAYDPSQFKDEEKARVLEAIDRKIAGQEVVASAHADEAPIGAQVIDLMAALQASLGKKPAAAKPVAKKDAKAEPVTEATARKGVKRAEPAEAAEAAGAEVTELAPARARAKK